GRFVRAGPRGARSRDARAPDAAWVTVRLLLVAASGRLVGQREHPHRAALRDVARPAELLGHAALHALGVDAPARLHSHVLHAVDLEGGRNAGHAGVRPELPEDIARLGVERAEHPVAGAAHENEAACGREDGAPVRRLERGGPHLLTGAEVPRLQLADVVRALDDVEGRLRACVALAGLVLDLDAGDRAAVVLVRRDVQEAGLRVVRLRRPVPAAPQRRAELDGAADRGLT